MQKRYITVVLTALSIMIGTTGVQATVAYRLCSGLMPLHQSCHPYPDQHICQQALQACQTAPGQVKPWLCGRCVPQAANTTVVYEVVNFQSKPGVSTTQMQLAAQKIQPVLNSMPGYIGRYFAVGKQHHFIDFVIWRTMHDALYAAKAVQRYQTMQRFNALIEPSSVSMQHLYALPL